LAEEFAGWSTEQGGQRKHITRPQRVQRRRLAVHIVHGKPTNRRCNLFNHSKLRNSMNNTKPISRFSKETQHHEPRTVDAGGTPTIREENPQVHTQTQHRCGQGSRSRKPRHGRGPISNEGKFCSRYSQ